MTGCHGHIPPSDWRELERTTWYVQASTIASYSHIPSTIHSDHRHYLNAQPTDLGLRFGFSSLGHQNVTSPSVIFFCLNSCVSFIVISVNTTCKVGSAKFGPQAR